MRTRISSLAGHLQAREIIAKRSMQRSFVCRFEQRSKQIRAAYHRQDECTVLLHLVVNSIDISQYLLTKLASILGEHVLFSQMYQYMGWCLYFA